MMWTQSSGFCEGIVKSVSTSTSTDQETKNSGTVSSQETLSGEAAESTLSREHFLIKKKAVSTFFLYIYCASLWRVRTLVLLITHLLCVLQNTHKCLIHAVIQTFVQDYYSWTVFEVYNEDISFTGRLIH